MIDVYADGAALPTNPGPAGAGAVGFWSLKHGDDLDREPVFELAVNCGWATNNVAEYVAATQGLEVARGFSRDARLFTDSRLVVEQFAGNWRCRSEHLQPLLEALWDVAATFRYVEVHWIPREENEHADRLSRRAIA